MNKVIDVLILAAGMFFTASILATAFNSNELRKGVELWYMNKLKRLTSDYLKKFQKTSMEAFEMGLQDGKSGEKPKIPPLPPMDNPKVYAMCLFSQDMYRDGYKVGDAVRRTTDERV